MKRHVSAAIAWLVLLGCIGIIAAALVLLAPIAGTPQGYWVLTTSFLAFPAVGALIVSRRPGNTIGWIFCAIGLGTAMTSFTAGYVQHTLAAHADAQLATGIIDALGNGAWPLNIGMGSLLLFLFPDGKLPSPRWRPAFWLDVVCIVSMILAGALQPGALESNGKVVNPIGIPGAGPLLDAVKNGAQTLFLVSVLAAIISVIVRYRHAAGVQRKQIKWFAYGAALIALIFTATVVIAPAVTPSNQDPSNSFVSNLGFSLGFVMLPIGAGVGVLRYRLYDIDVIINRTLVYGSLTVLLAAIYFAGVVGTQALVNAFSGQPKQQSPVAIVATTLLIAALFNPLRKRIQTFIDHRFYRRKYDAARTLARFGETLRSEVELDALRAHLLATVDETMQPAHVSLWLRPRGRSDV